MTGDRHARRWHSRDIIIFKTCAGRRHFVHTSIQRLHRRLLTAPCAFRKPLRAWVYIAHDLRRCREPPAGNQQQLQHTAGVARRLRRERADNRLATRQLGPEAGSDYSAGPRWDAPEAILCPGPKTLWPTVTSPRSALRCRCPTRTNSVRSSKRWPAA